MSLSEMHGIRHGGAHIELCTEAVTVVRAKASGGFNVEVGLKSMYKGANAIPCHSHQSLTIIMLAQNRRTCAATSNLQSHIPLPCYDGWQNRQSTVIE